MAARGRPRGTPAPRNDQDQLIKAAALAAGLPVAALARAIETPTSTIREWQAGKARMPGVAATLLRLIAEGAVSAAAIRGQGARLWDAAAALCEIKARCPGNAEVWSIADRALEALEGKPEGAVSRQQVAR